MYSPTSGFPQYQSPTSPAYLEEHSPSRGAVLAVATTHTHYQQPMAMSRASLERSVPRSRGATQLPYARAPPGTSVPYDIPAKKPELPIKKRNRKRADARQLEAINRRKYARTAFPSTEERLRLAKDLDMSARNVQNWLAHTFVSSCMIS